MRLKDKTLGQIALFLLLTCCIAFQSCYALLTVSEYTIIGYLLLVLALLSLLMVKPLNGGMLSKGCVAVGAVFLFGIMLSTLINEGFSFSPDTLRLLAVVAISLLIVAKVPFCTFISGFLTVLKVLTLVALFVWLLVNVFRVSMPLPEATNFRGLVYQIGYIFFLSSQYTDFGGLYDSLSIFWEPGIYSSFLLIGIALETSGVAELKKSDIALFSVAVLSTFSTAGIVLLPVAMSPLLFRKNGKFSAALFFALLSLTLVIVINMQSILQFLATVNYSLFGKLVQLDMLTTSTRIESPLINLNGWLLNPVIGNGLEGATNYYQLAMASSSAIDSMTSTSTYCLSAFGAFGAIPIVCWIAGVMRVRRVTIYQKVIFLTLIFIVLNKETHTATLFLYCLMFYLFNGQLLAAAK